MKRDVEFAIQRYQETTSERNRKPSQILDELESQEKPNSKKESENNEKRS